MLTIYMRSDLITVFVCPALCMKKQKVKNKPKPKSLKNIFSDFYVKFMLI